MADEGVDVLDIDRLGVDVPEHGVGASAALIVAVCVGMGVLVGAVFAIWYLIGSAWFGQAVGAFLDYIGYQLLMA